MEILESNCYIIYLISYDIGRLNPALDGEEARTYQRYPFGQLPCPRKKELTDVAVGFPRKYQPGFTGFNILHESN